MADRQTLHELEKRLHDLEKALADSEKRLREIMDNVNDLIYTHDLEGRFLSVNKSVTDMTGFEREEFINMNARRIMLPKFHEEFDEYMNRILQQGHAEGIMAVKNKQGETQYWEYHNTVSYRNGRPDFIQGIARDVTDSLKVRTVELTEANVKLQREVEERTRAETALRQSEKEYRKLYDESKRAEEVYRSLIHSSADAIVIYDMDQKVNYVSPVFTKMFGWTLEELKDRPIPFIPDSEMSNTAWIHKDLIEKGTSYQGVETRRYTKDGRILDVSLSASRYDDHKGRPAGVLVILRDITHTRKLQAELQHAQKMESIGTIASGVAHNFRNILSGISVNSQLVEMRYSNDDQLMDVVKRINGAVKRGARLVDGLMQFSRKQRTAEAKEIDLTRIIRETHDLISTSFDKKIDIQMELPAPVYVMGDYSALIQVIMNLCVNARDAMPHGGILRIQLQKKAHEAIIQISDTGLGMDKDRLEKCFDPFFTTKEVGKGTGLGLSTSYGIIKDHQGDIHVYSELGKGTTFKIHLPTSPLETDDSQSFRAKIIRGNGQTILIVDDEVNLLTSMAEILKDIGYRTILAENGETALAAYETSKPDAVLMDRNMPGLDGIACAENIHQIDPAAKVILISGYDEKGPNGIDPLSKKLISGYLTKPIDMVELSHALALLFDE